MGEELRIALNKKEKLNLRLDYGLAGQLPGFLPATRGGILDHFYPPQFPTPPPDRPH